MHDTAQIADDVRNVEMYLLFVVLYPMFLRAKPTRSVQKIRRYFMSDA